MKGRELVHKRAKSVNKGKKITESGMCYDSRTTMKKKQWKNMWRRLVGGGEPLHKWRESDPQAKKRERKVKEVLLAMKSDRWEWPFPTFICDF